MIFAVRQLQEKCREQNQELHLVFVDLTKAFDTVNRNGLWKILQKFGCPDKLTALIASFHDSMQVRVQENGDSSDPFQEKNGVKQGCVLAPTLFSFLFAAMLLADLRECNRGVYIPFRIDGKFFNLQRLKAKTRAANAPPPTPIIIHNTEIKTVDNFCYLGSTIMSSGSLDVEVMLRIGKASVALGQLTKRFSQDRGIHLSTKIVVYRAMVLSTLLCCCETWTTYRRHIKQLEQFHQRCLRKICGIKCQDRVSNLQVLEKCDLPSIECLITTCQLRWTGHVI
ncbi:uncharacterized protein [Penaeus vannamei]|uniref:uncharacterized protein n=1 Tax=Penaeus vannamei TaxID=6689 RepID=UPI00387F5E6D